MYSVLKNSLIAGFSFFILMSYTESFLQRKTSLRFRTVITILGTTAFYLSLLTPAPWDCLISIISSFISIHLIFKGTLPVHLFISLSFESINILMNLILTTLSNSFLEKESSSNFPYTSLYLVFFVYYILYLVFVLLRKLFHISLLRFRSSVRWTFFSSFIVLSFLFTLYYRSQISDSNSLFLPSIMLMVSVFLYYLIIQLQNYDSSLSEAQLSLTEYQHQLLRYKENLDHYESLRKINHDTKNELLYLRSLLKEGNHQRAIHYLDLMFDKRDARRPEIRTNHPVVDLVLQQKLSAATNQSVSLQLIFPDLSGFPLSEDDIVVLFSNLLDNCIEACTRLQHTDKTAVFVIKDMPKEWIICTTNPIEHTPTIKNGTIQQTTKEEPTLHGIGLFNIKKIISSYGGDDLITCKDGSFKHFVTIPKQRT